MTLSPEEFAIVEEAVLLLERRGGGEGFPVTTFVMKEEKVDKRMFLMLEEVEKMEEGAKVEVVRVEELESPLFLSSLSPVAAGGKGVEKEGGEGGGSTEIKKAKAVERVKVKARAKVREKRRMRTRTFRNVGVRDLESVLENNKKVLRILYQGHRADLEDKTNCRKGSLEWIRRIRDVLGAAVEGMERNGDGGDTEAIVALLKARVRGYEVELKTRGKYFVEAVRKWIPQYARMLNVILRSKQFFLTALQKGQYLHMRQVLIARCKVRCNTYKTLQEVVGQGLEDIAGGRTVRNLTENRAVAAKINRGRARRLSKTGRYGLSCVELPLKYTFFFIGDAAVRFQHSNCDCGIPKKQLQKNGIGGSFSMAVEVLEEELLAVKSVAERMREVGDKHKLGRGCGEQWLEKTMRAADLMLEEVVLITNVYDHMVKYIDEEELTVNLVAVCIEAAEEYLVEGECA